MASQTDLIESAQHWLNPHRAGDRMFGNVAATLETCDGQLFSGVCIDTGCGTGFCAEHSAVAAMVTAGHYRIRRIVAVWRDEQQRLYVLPPCGRCREFIRQIHEDNIDAEVVLGYERSVTLRSLLPENGWPAPLTDR